jgi:hypothetical protein
VAEVNVKVTGVLETVGGASAASAMVLPGLIRTAMTTVAIVASRCMYFSFSA